MKRPKPWGVFPFDPANMYQDAACVRAFASRGAADRCSDRMSDGFDAPAGGYVVRERRESALASERAAAYGWGVLLDRWSDEGRTAHLLRADNAPACGVAYRSASRRDVQHMAKCARCARIEKNLRADGARID